MKNASVLTLISSTGLFIVFGGTSNIAGLVVSILLMASSTAICIKLEPKQR